MICALYIFLTIINVAYWFSAFRVNSTLKIEDNVNKIEFECKSEGLTDRSGLETGRREEGILWGESQMLHNPDA